MSLFSLRAGLHTFEESSVWNSDSAKHRRTEENWKHNSEMWLHILWRFTSHSRVSRPRHQLLHLSSKQMCPLLSAETSTWALRRSVGSFTDPCNHLESNHDRGLFLEPPGRPPSADRGQGASCIVWALVFIQMTQCAYAPRLRANSSADEERASCVLGRTLTVIALVNTLHWILIFVSFKFILYSHSSGICYAYLKTKLKNRNHPPGTSGASSRTHGLVHMSWTPPGETAQWGCLPLFSPPPSQGPGLR